MSRGLVWAILPVQESYVKKPFIASKFVTGTAAFVEKNGTEYDVQFAGTTNLQKYPSTVTIGSGGDPDYAMCTKDGVLNTGEQLYMKQQATQESAQVGNYAGTGTVKGYINVYKDNEGEIRLGARLHKTAAKAQQKANDAHFSTIASGVPISW